MGRRTLLGTVLALAAGGPAVADIAPPVWLHHATVTTVLEVAEPFPDYAVFRVSTYRTSAPGFDRSKNVGNVISSGYSADEVAVAPDRPARITGDNSQRYSLYAVPRSAAGPGRDPRDLIEAVGQGRVPGSAHLSLDHLEPWDASADQSDLVLHYRLDRTPDGVAFTRLTFDGSSTFDGAPNSDRVRWVAAGIAAAVALAGLGLWWAGRGKMKPSGPPPAG
jgi:hypothetical protein